MDIDRRLLAVSATCADVQDQDGGIGPVKRLVRLCPGVQTVAVDSGYKGHFADAAQAMASRVVEVVRRPGFAKSCVRLPKR